MGPVATGVAGTVGLLLPQLLLLLHAPGSTATLLVISPGDQGQVDSQCGVWESLCWKVTARSFEATGFPPSHRRTGAFPPPLGGCRW